MDTSNVTTPGSYHFFDFMDSDAMVCSPSGPSKYRGMCYFNEYILGVIFTIQGLFLLYNAMRLKRMLLIVEPIVNDQSPPKKVFVKLRTRQRGQLLYFERLTCVLGLECICEGATLLVGGCGTVHATSTPAGQVSDLFFAGAIACTLYHCLLQLHGAQAFRNLVEIQNRPEGGKQQHNRVSNLLDFAQGSGAFPICFGFWLLLVCELITRSFFYSSLLFLLGGAGIRSMLENVLNRVRTLIRVDELQQNAGGNMEAMRRRRNTLVKKVRVLVFHFLSIALMNVVFPLGAIVFGFVNSSTQMLIHLGAFFTIMSAVMSVMCVVTHKHVNKSCARKTNLAKTTHQNRITLSTSRSNTKRVYTVADESGMSKVGVSEIATGRKQNCDVFSERRLFSDLEYELSR